MVIHDCSPRIHVSPQTWWTVFAHSGSVIEYVDKGQFLGTYAFNWVLSFHLDRTITLYVWLSKLRWLNYISYSSWSNQDYTMPNASTISCKFCPGSRLGGQPDPPSNLYPSLAEITAHAITSAVEEGREERTKRPYSLDINLIITRLSIVASRRVLNRFSYSTSRVGRTTSRCESPRHARDLSSIFDGFTDLDKIFNQDHQKFVAECCTHFPQLLVLERKENLKLGLKLGEEWERIQHKHGHIWVGVF